MRFSLLLSVLVLACGSSSPKPAAPVEAAPPVASAPPEPAPAPPAPPAPPAIPEAPPPVPAGPPRPHVAKALAYLPADTQAVVGLDVARIAGTPLGDKFREALLSAKLPAACETLTSAQFGHVVLGIGPSGKVVAVSDGKLAERAMFACVEAGMKAKGGKAQRKTVRGRTYYYATGTTEDNGWITFLKPGFLIANSEAALTEALDAKAGKVSGDLAALSAQVDHGRMVWMAATVPVASLAELGVPADVAAGPIALRASLDMATDTQIDVVLGGASPEVAAAVAKVLRTLAAQLPVPPAAIGLQIGVHGSDIHAIAQLDASLTRTVIDAIKMK